MSDRDEELVPKGRFKEWLKDVLENSWLISGTCESEVRPGHEEITDADYDWPEIEKSIDALSPAGQEPPKKDHRAMWEDFKYELTHQGATHEGVVAHDAEEYLLGYLEKRMKQIEAKHTPRAKEEKPEGK